MELALIRLTASTAAVHQDLSGIVVKKVRATERSLQQNYNLFMLLQWYPVDTATITNQKKIAKLTGSGQVW